MEPPDRRPTGADVARIAGVNQASVSRVFSGKATGRVSPEIEAKIREVATALGYQPHASGRSLRSGSTNALGLVVTDFENPFFGRVSKGAQREAEEHGCSMVLMQGGYRGDAFVPYVALDSGLVDGLLVFSSILAVPPAAHRKARLTFIETEYEGFRSVVLNPDGGLLEAVEHLHGLGHRHIAYLGVNLDRWTLRRRRDAWRAAMEAVVGKGPTVEVNAPLNVTTAAAVTRQLLTAHREVTALICADDLLAAGAYRAAAEVGRAIPNDLSILGFGGTSVGDALWPRITAISIPGAELGAAAVRLHLSGIEDKDLQRQVNVQLVVRDSTGPVPSS